jgi:hypothetical protein
VCLCFCIEGSFCKHKASIFYRVGKVPDRNISSSPELTYAMLMLAANGDDSNLVILN